MDDLNEKIYRILSWIRFGDETIGTERIASKIYNDIMQGGDDIEVAVSGSYSEGTNFNEIVLHPEHLGQNISDIDSLFIFKAFYAGTKNGSHSFYSLVLDNKYLEYEISYDILKKDQLSWLFTEQDDQFVTRYSLLHSMKYHTVLEIEEENCKAGYLRLRYSKECKTLFSIMYPKNNLYNVFSQKSSVLRENKHYLSSARFMQTAAPVILKESGQRINEGPSLDESDDYDTVPAVRSPYWPNDALQMITRKSKSGVPTNELKAKLLLKGCLMVAVGHKSSPNRDIEWRYSFSECETELCQSWNYIQLHTYTILKLLKNKYFNGLISSYYMKTCMLWAIEWFDQSFWIKENLLYSIERILQILIDFLKERNIPNYFIEKNNMVSHFDEQDFSITIDKLEDVKANVGQYIWKNIFRGLYTDPFGEVSARNNQTVDNSYNWNDLSHYWLTTRLCRGSMDATSAKVKFDIYMRIVPEIRKISDNVFTNHFLSIVKASHAHTILCLYLKNGWLEDKIKSAHLFASKFLANPILGQIQLALFYFVTGDIKKTLDSIYEIPEEHRELSYNRLIFNHKGDKDIILVQEELYLYKLLIFNGTDGSAVWRFNSILFSKYLEITSLLKLSHIHDAFLQALDYFAFLTEVTEKKVDEDFINSGNYLYQLIKKSFNLTLMNLLSQTPSLIRPNSVLSWFHSLFIYYVLNPK